MIRFLLISAYLLSAIAAFGQAEPTRYLQVYSNVRALLNVNPTSLQTNVHVQSVILGDGHSMDLTYYSASSAATNQYGPFAPTNGIGRWINLGKDVILPSGNGLQSDLDLKASQANVTTISNSVTSLSSGLATTSNRVETLNTTALAGLATTSNRVETVNASKSDSTNGFLTDPTVNGTLLQTTLDSKALQSNLTIVSNQVTGKLNTTNGTSYYQTLDGVFEIPQTTATNGIAYMGTNLFLHAYHDPANDGHNTFLGANAGNLTLHYGGGDVNEGAHNVGVGDFALQSLTTGYANNAFGYVSQQYSTNAYHNAGFGDDTLRVNQGHNNTAIGIISMRGNVTGFQNTAVGHQSLDGNISGNYNVAIGNTALLSATNADRNTGIGEQSLYHALGGNNTAVGQNAGYTTTGANNVMLGTLSGFYATGDANFIVDSILRANAAAEVTNSIFYGHIANPGSDQWLNINAAVTNTQGIFANKNIYAPSTTATVGGYYINNSRFLHNYSDPLSNGHNTFVGLGSGNFTMAKVTGIDASYNSGVGEAALASLTTGSENAASGYGVLGATTTGIQNAGFGSSSLASSVIGNYNTGIGQGALTLSTSDRNTAVGRASLNKVVTGQRNTAVGESAGFNILGDRNTLIGHNSGFTGTGSDNVMLGAFSGFYETGSNKFFVDNQTRANEASGRTNALMYGTFDSTSRSNQTLAINANMTTLGITASTINGTSVTATTLTAGNSIINNNGFYAGGGAAGQGRFWYSGTSGSTMQGQTGTSFDLALTSLSGSTVFAITHTNSTAYVNGNMGVGVMAPSEKLDVAGNIAVSGIVYATNGFVGNLTGNASSSTVATNLANNQGTTTTMLAGNASGAPQFVAVSEPFFSFTDITTANATTSKHGLLPKLDGNAAHYLDGSGAFSTPAGSGGTVTSVSGTANEIAVATGTTTPALSFPNGHNGTGAVALTNGPTLNAPFFLGQPSISDFTLATHSHQNNAGGGTLDAAAIGSGTLATARLATNVLQQKIWVQTNFQTVAVQSRINFLAGPGITVEGTNDTGGAGAAQIYISATGSGSGTVGTVVNSGTPVAGAFFKNSGTTGTNSVPATTKEDGSGNVTFGGGVSTSVRVVTSDYTAAYTDHTILLSASGNMILTLPAATGHDGFELYLKANTLDMITISPQSGEHIDNNTSLGGLTSTGAFIIQAVNNDWWIMGAK